jgi:hypothetical protein
VPRPLEQKTAPGESKNERCTKGWLGGPCKKRTCRICGLRWAKDWRRVLFTNLKEAGPMVALSAVTPPGQKELPYDEGHCAHLGPHVHGKRYGCRIDEDALAWWSRDISRRWRRLHNAARNATIREGGRCLPLLTRVWEPQARGAAHVHPVFALESPDDARIAFLYFEQLARLAPRHGFGFVGQKKGSSVQILSGERAAAYLSSYFVRGSREKATLQENARNPYLPHLLIWVSPKVTKVTGITMRILRRLRHLWAIRKGLCPPPSWSAVELVRVIRLAGSWPQLAHAP